MNLLLSDPAFLSVVSGGGGYDPDAQAYITAVETADGQTLETSVKDAINDFVLGCKADGIWPAIKASCILAGARTIDGALVPLVGTAPTSFNFVAGDYNRKTGLVGNASTKYLDSNRNNNADPQNNKHLSVYVSTRTSSAFPYIATDVGPGRSFLLDNGLSTVNKQSFYTAASAPLSNSFTGASRFNANQVNHRVNGQSYVVTSAPSETPLNINLFIYRRLNAGGTEFSNARLAFYSIGEALDLALLDVRVTDLITAFGAAIP